MSVAPGLIGDFAASPLKVFLGSHPKRVVEKKLTRQLQAVYPWYVSRKRVKEQANEFIELDLASADAETMNRYAHVHYVRRQIHQAIIEKQVNALDTGKPPKLADPGLVDCLNEANSLVAHRMHYELKRLGQTKAAARIPNRRELDPDAPLEPWDVGCMMRCAGEDAYPEVVDAEAKARQFLPADRVATGVNEVVTSLFSGNVGALDKKDQKLLGRYVLPDYQKVGAKEKVRAVDVTTQLRFTIERVAPGDTFTKALWGNVARRYATHPSLLASLGGYWAATTDGFEPPIRKMPNDVASAVCGQQLMFPAIRFRSQYLYTSQEAARQGWPTEQFVPSLRLMGRFGNDAAEDLAASVLVDAFWSSREVESEANILDDNFIREVASFVKESGSLQETNTALSLQRIVDAIGVVCPPVTPEEREAAGFSVAAEGSGEESEGSAAPESESEEVAAEASAE